MASDGRAPAALDVAALVASMRPRLVGLGWRPARLSRQGVRGRFNEAEAGWPRMASASARSRGRMMSFNEAEAGWPRMDMSRLRASSSTSSFNEAEAGWPRMARCPRYERRCNSRFNEAEAGWPRMDWADAEWIVCHDGASMRPRLVGLGWIAPTGRFATAWSELQ